MKKLISVIVAFSMMLSLAFQSVSASSDLTDAASYEQKLLFDLGVIEFEKASALPVSRAAFTRYAMKLADIPVTPHVGTVFEDVTSSNPDYNYIMSAVDFGLISKATSYRPNDAITLSEASKIIVELLGYDYITESNGGYPHGYLQTARSIGALNGVTVSTETLDEKNACLILYNALFINLPELTYTQDGVSQYKVGEGTILSSYRKLEQITGIVDGNAHYSADSDNGLGEGRISINGVVYDSGDINANHLFGCNVYAYVDMSSKKVISCQMTESNKVVKIYAEDIVSYNNRSFVYADESGKEKSITITIDANVFYNGKNFVFDSSKFIPESGSLTFISPEGSTNYSTLLIKSYKTIVVDRIINSDYTIIDKYDKKNQVVLDPSEVEYTITDQDGNPMTLDSVGEGDILCVAMSEDGKIAEVVCVDFEFMGTYSGYSNDYIQIDGTNYKVTPAIKDKISSIISLGKEAIFRLDIDNRVADVSVASSAGGNIGYLFWGKCIEKGVSTTLYARILALDGKTYLYKFADTFAINGQGYKDYTEAWNEHKSPDYNSLLCGMVLYSLDSDGNLKSLTYSDKEGGNGGLYVTHSVEEADRYHTYEYYYHTVGMDIICDTSLKIFKVPAPSWSVDNIDVEDYTVEAPEYIADNEVAVGYKLVGYTTVEKDGVAKYLLMQKINDDFGESDEVVEYDGQPYMVNAVKQVILDDEYREAMELCGSGRGPDNPLVVYSKDENSFTQGGISGGDIVQVKTTIDNIVKNFRIVHKRGETSLSDGGDRMFYKGDRVKHVDMQLAYVHSFRGDAIHLVRKSLFNGDSTAPENIKPFYWPSGTFMRYNDKLDCVESLSVEDFRDYETFGDDKSMVLFCTVYYSFTGMFMLD